MQGFRRLNVWQKAHDLTLEVYRVTARFPKEELYALTSQLKRAASYLSRLTLQKDVEEGATQTSLDFY